MLTIAKSENCQYTKDGMEALLFIADGDLRNAVNSLQAAYSGFDIINSENVYKVNDSHYDLAISRSVTNLIL